MKLPTGWRNLGSGKIEFRGRIGGHAGEKPGSATEANLCFYVENAYTAESDTVVLATHLYLRGDRYVYRTSIKLEDADQVPREARDSPLF